MLALDAGSAEEVTRSIHARRSREISYAAGYVIGLPVVAPERLTGPHGRLINRTNRSALRDITVSIVCEAPPRMRKDERTAKRPRCAHASAPDVGGVPLSVSRVTYRHYMVYSVESSNWDVGTTRQCAAEEGLGNEAECYMSRSNNNQTVTARYRITLSGFLCRELHLSLLDTRMPQ